MRLIITCSLQLEEFLDNAIPPYAILSHTWESNEVSFADFTSDVEGAKKKHAFHKIEDTCRQAALDGLEYAWVDTTCINKASSAELSEAINSMFKWYQNAKICYAYLSDVTKSGLTDQLPKSRWFTRGWTLQELIAPNDVIFYGKEWELLGSKREHARLIGKITGIDQTVLAPGNYYTSFEQAALGPGKSFTLHNISIAKRMAWASRRQTTRTEDMAYCLLGIFDVNMPLLYGEGKKAFLRLQEEIIRVVNDASIFAWGLQKDTKKLDVVDLITTRQQGPKTCPILAESPAVFQGCSHISQVDSSSARQPLPTFSVSFSCMFMVQTCSCDESC
ncbi:heterokaryon incompatibility protein-domain-containing protein [Phaeosphaeria sp. MPI-PUGE-AT-0046c]|nr:heterokaryon incompatibility protein-domain-containing protein [Phaeosphaeria sp. MPI-PUGE-AT-0046c]